MQSALPGFAIASWIVKPNRMPPMTAASALGRRCGNYSKFPKADIVL